MAAIDWDSARLIARGCVEVQASVAASLPEALGAVLAKPVEAMVDLPAFDVASTDGWALAGPGPWEIRAPRARDVLAGHSYHEDPESVPLRDGQAAPVAAGDPIGSDVTAVAPSVRCEIADGRLELAECDPGQPLGISPGSGIRSRGSDAFCGDTLVPAGTPVTASLLALAALAGHDDLEIIPPPEVVIIRVGDELVDFGVARAGLGRDAVAPALPGWLVGIGARCHPDRWVTQNDAALIDEIEDAPAGVVIASGPFSGTSVRRVLAGLGANVLVDGVACRPGDSMLLALLPDDRPLIHCGPGSPADALAAVLTLIAPVVATLSGRAPASSYRRLDETVRSGPNMTRLIPVVDGEAGTPGVNPVLPGGPGGMSAWSAGTMAAVIPPGGVTRHRRVEVLPIP